MRRSRILILAWLAVCGIGLPWNSAQGQEASSATPDKAIRAAADAFTEAFNRGNAKDVAAQWTVNGTLADESGQIVRGREAIEAKYAEFFKANPGVKLEVTIKSIEFPTSNVAIEDGVARVSSEQPGPPSASRYTVVHTLDNGKWLMASVREAAINLPSNFAHLEDLQWLIGSWESKSEDTTLTSHFRWIANKSFLQREYVTRTGGVVTGTGLQIIGWNPRSGRLQSWSFDSSGGHGEGDWWPTDTGWRIQSIGVLADGTATSSIDVLIRTPDEANVFGWRSFDRKVGNVSFPDTPEVVFDRAGQSR